MQAADSFIRGQLASNSDSSACDVASQSDAESGETAGSCAPLRWRCTLCVGVHAYFLCRCVVRVRLCRVFRGPATGEGGPLCLIRVRSQTLTHTGHRRVSCVTACDCVVFVRLWSL
jgi:hypothetical protein